MPRSKEYWKRRMEAIAEMQNKKADDYILSLEKQYNKAMATIQLDLEKFYLRYAEAEGITYNAALKRLTDIEQEMWEVSLGEYKRMALSEQFIDEIESIYSRSRISRLRALEIQIQMELDGLYTKINKDLEDLLVDGFTNTYYRTIYEIQKGTGIGSSFATFDDSAVRYIISQPWKWGHFSDTIWDNKKLLLDELKTALSQSFIRGDSMNKVIKRFAERMGVGKSRAANVIQTEHAYICSEANAKSYEETGIEWYEYLATLDTRTSNICRDMDGEKFKIKDKVTWLNYPPLHCRCRSTTVPWLEDEEEYGERIAKKHEGKNYHVPGDMKYQDWYNEYVKGNPEELLAEKKHKNKYSDKKQHAKYREVLGKEAPKSFDKFQKLKYTNKEEWNLSRYDYKLRKEVLDNPSVILEDYTKLSVDERKYTNYLFNGSNEAGLAKGKAFESRLGYSIENYNELDKIIKNNISKYPSIFKSDTPYGKKYEVNMVLKGLKNKQAKVKIGIIVDEDSPRITTIFIDKLKESEL